MSVPYLPPEVAEQINREAELERRRAKAVQPERRPGIPYLPPEVAEQIDRDQAHERLARPKWADVTITVPAHLAHGARAAFVRAVRHQLEVEAERLLNESAHGRNDKGKQLSPEERIDAVAERSGIQDYLRELDAKNE